MRVVTYNVHKCAGLDQRVMPRRVAEVIRGLQADVIGLQEITEPQAQRIAELLEMNLVMGEVRRHHGAAYGNAVLSGHAMSGICAFDLTAPGRERRGCIRTDVGLPDGQVLHAFNFHLGTQHGERQWQARRIVEIELLRSKDLRGPRVVVGDFNEWTHGLVSTMFAAELKPIHVPTYPGIWPVLRLDHIYYDADLVLEHAFLHRTMKTMIASDHLPLVADFKVRSDG
jgi:endonuclease/exonuclease/phosphatase family metal-dependent hydrolase